MKKTDIRQKIALRHRASIRSFMAREGLRVSPWCTKAGITEGALRNFLNGESDAMGANNLELLATAAGATVGELLGEQVHYKADDNLMIRSAKSILTVAKTKRMKLSRAEEMVYTVKLYNLVIEYRRKGSDVSPNEAMADLILSNRVA